MAEPMVCCLNELDRYNSNSSDRLSREPLNGAGVVYKAAWLVGMPTNCLRSANKV